MSQISPPVRILLIGSVVFLAAWFAFLRPGSGTEDVPAPATAQTTAPATQPGAQTNSAAGAAVQKAVDAQQAEDAAAAAASGESAPGAGGTTAPSTSAATPSTSAGKPSGAAAATGKAGKVSAKGLPVPVAKAIASKKVLVLLFWNPKAADDRAVRRAVKGIDRHHGKVTVHVAKIGQIARYAPITRGVDVQQSPSVIVVDRKRQAELLTGYSDRLTIEQAVSDALRAS